MEVTHKHRIFVSTKKQGDNRHLSVLILIKLKEV